MLYACPPCAQSFRVSERVIRSCTDVCSDRPSHPVDILPSTSSSHTDPVNWIDVRLATAQRCKCAARLYRVCVVPGGILCIFCMEGFERHGHATPPVLMRTHTIAPSPKTSPSSQKACSLWRRAPQSTSSPSSSIPALYADVPRAVSCCEAAMRSTLLPDFVAHYWEKRT